MKRLLLALVALLAVAVVAAPAADAGKKSVKLKVKKPKAVATGLSWTSTDTMTIDMTAKTGNTSSPIQSTETVEVKVDVLEASDDRIDKVRVTFGTTKDVRSGKSYLIEPGTSGPMITADGGGAITEDEQRKVMLSHGDLVRRTPMRWMVGRTFKRGKEVAVEGMELSELLSIDVEARLDDLKVTLERATRKVARFSFSATVPMRGKEDEGAEYDLLGVIEGTFEVDLRRLLVTDVEYELSVGGTIKTGPMEMKLVGKLTGARQVVYRD